MGIQFQNGAGRRGRGVPAGRRGRPPARPRPRLRRARRSGPARRADHDPRPSPTAPGRSLDRREPAPEAGRRARPGRGLHHHRHPGGQHEPAEEPVLGPVRDQRTAALRRPATLKTGTSNEARDLNAYGYIAAPDDRGRKDGEYALVVGAWNGNSDNSLVSTPGGAAVLDRRHDLRVAGVHGGGHQGLGDQRVRRAQRPRARRRSTRGRGSRRPAATPVEELFLPGTAPTRAAPDARCGEAVLTTAGFEDEHASWMAANHGWLIRARRGPGVRGGPEDTATAYFYNPVFNPYGRSWGPLRARRGLRAAEPRARPSPSTRAPRRSGRSTRRPHRSRARRRPSRPRRPRPRRSRRRRRPPSRRRPTPTPTPTPEPSEPEPRAAPRPSRTRPSAGDAGRAVSAPSQEFRPMIRPGRDRFEGPAERAVIDLSRS